MPARAISQIRKTAGQFAYGSVLYNWSLRGSVPERLLVKPVDPWSGDAERGRWLCGGTFAIDGDQLEMRGDFWEPDDANETWLAHMHGFEWLRDLRTLGGDGARRYGRALMQSWMEYYPVWHRLAWRPDITAKRVAMWISHFESFTASASDDFQDEFFDSLMRQSRHLSRSLPGDLNGVALLHGAKGLLYAGLAFEGRENWIEQALTIFEREIGRQILNDGGHVSRSPALLLEALQILLDARGALMAGGYPGFDKIQHAIDKMGPALRFFRYADKGLALFNGAQEGNIAYMDSVLAQANARGKALQSMPCTGYERVALGRSMIMIDTGKTPAWPYDGTAHAAPLAFEFCYGSERLFVNCGAHPTQDEWQDALRATAAHNTAGIDSRNACEIREGGHMGRKVRTVVTVREDSKKSSLVEASHDGYVALNGVTHGRRLYMTDKGCDLRGEDTFTCATGLARPHDIAIRFHIHPRVQVTLTQGGDDALLRMPGGTGWRFMHGNGALALEDSIYLGEGTRPRKTKQLVIYGRMEKDFARVKWALRREGV
ncbi:MAG TPA: heparinase [Rhodospirillaceae bacterium]|nr:heparinase [Rhodospirillaceae bacterium]